MQVKLLCTNLWQRYVCPPGCRLERALCRVAGSQLLLGPWTHSGLLDNSVGHHRHGAPSRFSSRAHILRFIEQALEGAHTGQTEQAHCWQGQDGPAIGAVPEGGAVHETQARPEAAAIAARALAPSSAPTMPLSASAGEIALPSLAVLLLKRCKAELAYMDYCPPPISRLITRVMHAAQ